VPNRLIGDINNAIASAEYVIIYFCARPLRGIYGIARVVQPIPLGTMGLGPAMSPEFPIIWMRTLRLSLRTVAQVKPRMSIKPSILNPYLCINSLYAY
jgi:hypothetical protein